VLFTNNPLLFRDHEIVLELGTPARNHMIFPDKEVKIKLVSFKLLNKEKVAIPLKRSFEDLPPNKTLVPKLILKERIGLQSGGSSKVSIFFSFHVFLLI
jgi:hypothetical protein